MPCFPLSHILPRSDGPKQTDILMAAEQQQEPGGRRFVTLSCSSRSYPPVTYYSWFKKMSDKQEDLNVKVSTNQNHTVYSDNPGYYFCVAENEMGQKSSILVSLFAERESLQGHVFVCECVCLFC